MSVGVIALPGVGVGTILLAAILAAIIVLLLVKLLDMVGDLVRKRGLLFHVRDKALVRLAKRYNGGTLLAGTGAVMYFTHFNIAPWILDVQGLANIILMQGGIATRIRMGWWDSRTHAGIAKFAVGCPAAAAAIAANPSLGTPTRQPVLIVSAARESWYASYFGGGIDVAYEVPTLYLIPRLGIKSVITIPPEKVPAGKYRNIPPVF